MYVVYVIQSINHDFTYVGLTNNLERRLKQHNRKQANATKPYAPYYLLYQESFDARVQARSREKYLKSTAGKNYLRKILPEYKLKTKPTPENL